MRRLLLVCLLAGSPALAEPSTRLEVNAPTAKPERYLLVVRGRKLVRYEVLLNALPLASGTGDDTQVAVPIDASWLHAGENTLEVHVVGPTKVARSEGAALELALHDLPAGADEGDLEGLRLVHWRLTARPRPHQVAGFVLPDRRWPIGQLWAKAEVVQSLTEADKVALTALQKRRVEAFRTGDRAALEKLEKFRLDVATQSGPEVRGEANKMLDLITAPEQKAQLADLTLKEPATFELVGEGRVAIVSNPIVGAPVPMRTWAARIGGAWVVVPDSVH
ncbi:MAG: hypothetical protein ABI321_02285 [Polyangia bacterium]